MSKQRGRGKRSGFRREAGRREKPEEIEGIEAQSGDLQSFRLALPFPTSFSLSLSSPLLSSPLLSSAALSLSLSLINIAPGFRHSSDWSA